MPDNPQALSEYEERMLSAYAQKQRKLTSKLYGLYRCAYIRYNELERRYSFWIFSWRAFFGGFYSPRDAKAHRAAIVFFIVERLLQTIAFIAFIFAFLYLSIEMTIAAFKDMFQLPSYLFDMVKAVAEQDHNYTGATHWARDRVESYITLAIRCTYIVIFALLALRVIICGYAPYFTIYRFCAIKEEIEGEYAGEEERVLAMERYDWNKTKYALARSPKPPT